MADERTAPHGGKDRRRLPNGVTKTCLSIDPFILARLKEEAARTGRTMAAMLDAILWERYRPRDTDLF